MRNTLYYGDNLTVMREHVPTASVDLIYADPPFNSNRSYNVLFKDESGAASDTLTHPSTTFPCRSRARRRVALLNARSEGIRNRIIDISCTKHLHTGFIV